ncbi:MAG: NAD-glutamate dehydrogenase [Desulfuromonas sp.]|nr:NAD-glutamate dehydrogenase [Desulfuromonas sp.]
MKSSSHYKIIQKFHGHLAQLNSTLQGRFNDSQSSTVCSLLDLLKKRAFPGDLLNLDTEQLTEIVSTLFTTVSRRSEDVEVHYVPLPQQNSSLLICTTVDALYLFDSLLLFLKRHHLEWQEICHLRLEIERDNDQLLSLSDAVLGQANESLMIVQIEQVSDSDRLTHGLEYVLREVLQFAADSSRLVAVFDDLQSLVDDAGYGGLWQWLKEDNFVPLSYRRLRVDGEGGQQKIQAVSEEALGLSDDPNRPAYLKPVMVGKCDEHIQSCLLRSSPLLIAETPLVSPVWRDEALTSICFREDIDSQHHYEHLIYGLYTSQAQRVSALEYNELQEKITIALAELDITEQSYNYRKIEELLATFPKPELFFMSVKQVKNTINSLLFYPQSSIRVVPLDSELNNIKLLLIIPRSLSQNADFTQVENHLTEQFKTQNLSLRVLQFDNETYILQVTARCSKKLTTTDFDLFVSSLTRQLQSWQQKLHTLLVRKYGSEQGVELWHRYSDAFCPDYRSRIQPDFCLCDIYHLEQLVETDSEQVELWGPVNGTNSACRLQFYSVQQGYLNELMPLLVNLDLTIIDEVDFTLTVDGRELFIKSFGVLNKLPGEESLLDIKDRLIEALYALRSGLAENDYLNRLLVPTGLDWQQIDIFRAYRNYYFQLGSAFSKRTVAFALINNPQAARSLYRYFESRFKVDSRWSDPMVREEEALFPARMELIEALRDVDNVNEDRILRTMFNLIDSTVRTNFFKRKNLDDYFFSFKISAIGITEMPVPRPLFEVYVHNATMEGIHLRGGMVARGGIRWSDRPDDFRTEILGLMKTQMTKNAQIVPVGSKGGFIVKQPYADRELGLALSKRAYQTLMRGLLDLTDNRIGGQIVPAADIVSYDEPDPYLVVAADKGTAHLSDTANAVSREYRFWLDDGFASGGSHGYDHKVLGITARGAWISVQRHFREMGIDIQTQPFSVVGIGDMGGDVFGNGMLLSEQICLKAAFNHRHIFLDPDPDPAATFIERKRLFELPRSNWSDFDASLISEGGGVFERDAKEIPLSEQVRSWLGVRHETLDGDSLIRLLLCAEIDLLWNGGIGTYVKSTSEKDEDAGDRANDALRINGNQLQAKVIGEGGNLGMTQLARIEYALNGGRINTDAIDNAGGVDCSDHEVNLKIFMQQLIETEVVKDNDQRDEQLEQVTDDVCDAVLDNNYGQSLCLSLDMLRNQQDRELFVDLAARLDTIGLLNPQSESLPTTKEVVARKNGYTRPELAILLAYSKMQLYQDLLEDEFPDSPAAAGFLAAYYPEAIAERYSKQLDAQPLRREIIATMITNIVINQAGAAFCYRVARRYDITLPQVAAAYLHFDQLLGAKLLREQIFALDNQMPSDEQYRWLMTIENTLASLCDWALSQAPHLTEFSRLDAMRGDLDQYRRMLSSVLDEERWKQYQQQAVALENRGLTVDIALQLTTLPALDNLLPMVALTQQTSTDLHSAAMVLNDVQEKFEINGLLSQVEQVPLRDRWDRMTRHMLRTGYRHALFVLSEKVLQEHDGNVDTLLATQRVRYRRFKRLQAMTLDQPAVNFHPLIIVLDHLNGLF